MKYGVVIDCRDRNVAPWIEFVDSVGEADELAKLRAREGALARVVEVNIVVTYLPPLEKVK